MGGPGEESSTALGTTQKPMGAAKSGNDAESKEDNGSMNSEHDVMFISVSVSPCSFRFADK